MRKKQSINLLLTLISVAVSASFGFVGWKYNEQSVIWYVGALLVAISALLALFFFYLQNFFLSTVSSLEARTSASRIEHYSEQKLLIESLSDREFLEIYCNVSLFDYFENSLKISRPYLRKLSPKIHLSGMSSIGDRFREFSHVQFNPFPPFANVVVVKGKGDGAEEVILCTNPIRGKSVWVHVLDATFASGILESLEKDLYANYHEIIDSDWLIAEIGQFYEKWMDYYRFGNVVASDRHAVSSMQLKQSTAAKSMILACDTSDISIWEEGGRCFSILRSNISARTSGCMVKRVFSFSSRKDIDSENGIRLAKVLHTHKEGGLEYGVMFEDEWADEKILDFAIYDSRVAWVETKQGKVHVGGGYFTTSVSEIDMVGNLFVDIWENDARPVVVNANQIIKMHAQHLNT